MTSVPPAANLTAASPLSSVWFGYDYDATFDAYSQPGLPTFGRDVGLLPYNATAASFPPGTSMGTQCINPSLSDVQGLMLLKAAIVNASAAHMTVLNTWQATVAPC